MAALARRACFCASQPMSEPTTPPALTLVSSFHIASQSASHGTYVW